MENIFCDPLYNDAITSEDAIDIKIKKCGWNTGNVVWSECIKNSIEFDKILSIYELNEIRTDVNYVIPAANHINLCVGTLETYRNMFPTNQFHVTIMGLGAQLTKEINTPRKLVSLLPKERIKALFDFSLNTEVIGVRGEISAECLKLMGIHNFQIIGCPSFFSNGHEFRALPQASSDKLCFSWGSEDPKNEQYVKELIRQQANEKHELILQSMEDFPKTLFENMPLLERHIKRCYPDCNVAEREIEDYIKERGHIFFNQNDWREYLSNNKFTMSTGCRFHGNMIALLAGIPALWISHDSRTEELVKALKLPSIELEKAAKIQDIEELTAACEYKKDFYDNYERLYKDYLKFLSVNNLQVRKFCKPACDAQGGL